MSEPAGLTVYIVDHDPAQRKAITRLVESAGMTAHPCASAIQFLGDFDPDHAGCLVLDLNLPGMSGLELARTLRSRHVPLPIIIVTGLADVPSAVESMKLGTLDFFLKPVDPDALILKIREALHLSQTPWRGTLHVRDTRRRLASLTPREREILGMLVVGESNKRIAASLGISIRTVINHRVHLMAKMQARNAADLARMCAAADALNNSTPLPAHPAHGNKLPSSPS